MPNWNHDAIRKAATDMLKQEEARKTLTSLRDFSQKYLNVGDLEGDYEYLEWYKYLEYPPPKTKGIHKLVLVHPASGKSRWVQMKIIKTLCENRSARIAIVSISAKTAHRYMAAIASILQTHQPLIDAFGPFWDGKTEWNMTEIRVLGSKLNIHTPSILNIGMKSSVEGMRFDLVVGDDMTDDKAARSPTDTKYAMLRINTLEERGPIKHFGEYLIFGHRFGINDVYGRIMEELPVFDKIILPPILKNGNTLVPELWTPEMCMAKLNSMPKWKVRMGYWQQATAPEDATFEWEWVKNNIVDTLPMSRPIKRTTVMDPAYTENKTSDFSAGWTGLPFRDHIILVGLYHDRISSGHADKYIDFALETQSSTLAIEQNNAKTLPNSTKDRANARNIPIGIIGFDSMGNKVERISDLEPWLKNGKLKFHRSLTRNKGWTEFKAQIMMYPHIGHVDILDALAMIAIRLINTPKKREKVQYVTPASRYGSPTDGKRPWEL